MEGEELKPLDPELEVIKLHKESALAWRERRHDDWTENYTLYRDKVIVNRLTQRQTVNIPLMKQSVKTLLKEIDDPPFLFYQNLDNDKQKEIFYNEYWEKSAEDNKLPIRDIVDKKNTLFYGRSFKKLNILDGRFFFGVHEPWDFLVERYGDPTILDLARFVSHIHIFKPLSSLELNPAYERVAIQRLKEYSATEQGLLKSEENIESLEAKNERMKTMGVLDIDNPILGETYVEISENYIKRYDKEKGKEEIWLYTVAEDKEILAKRPLESVIGVTKDHFWQDHFPFVSWGEDEDCVDFWTDGAGDVVRPVNKVLNADVSQLVENRTLRNFGMHYYDATQEGFTPQTFEPVPWGWYPVPGKPGDVLQKVDIPDLSESLDEMTFLIQLIEKATASTATSAGAPAQRQITLGEIQLSLAEAKERAKSSSPFYNDSWKEFGTKFIKMIEANPDKLDAVKVYKTGFHGNVFSKEIEPKNWMTKSGYQIKVKSGTEKSTEDMEALQKLNAAKGAMPDNQPLNEIYQKRLLDFAGLNPDETQEVMKFEKEKQSKIAELAAAGTTTPALTGGAPTGSLPAAAVPAIA